MYRELYDLGNEHEILKQKYNDMYERFSGVDTYYKKNYISREDTIKSLNYLEILSFFDAIGSFLFDPKSGNIKEGMIKPMVKIKKILTNHQSFIEGKQND